MVDKINKITPSSYDPKGFVADFHEDEDITEDVVTYREDGLFHIGQGYQGKVADTVVCKHCGGNQFNVGKGSYFTAIRCVNCEWEVCIHDG